MNALMDHMALCDLGLSEVEKETNETRRIPKGKYRVVANPDATVFLRDSYGTLWRGPFTDEVKEFLEE